MVKKNGPNLSNMVFNSLKLNTMVKIGQNVSELSKYGQKVVQNGPKWSQMIKHYQNILIWSDIVQNGSKWSKKV